MLSKTPSNAEYHFDMRKARSVTFLYRPIPFLVNEIVDYLIDFMLFFKNSFSIR